MPALTLSRAPARLLAVALFVTVGLSAGSLPVDAAEEATVPCVDPRGCPDLVVLASTFQPSKSTRTFTAADCAVREGATQEGYRTLLRFTFTTPNVGRGDLVVGNPGMHPEWFQWGECHNHWHFREYADYRLWTPSGYAQWDELRAANPSLKASEVLALNPRLAQESVASHKQGFCVIDIALHTVGVPKFVLCDLQGISVGWADEYHSSLDGQWVDVTGVAPGFYVLEAEVNAEWLFEESDYSNNRAAKTVEI